MARAGGQGLAIGRRCGQDARRHGGVRQHSGLESCTDPGSKGALSYYAFKMALGGKLSEAVAVPADLSDQDIVAAIGKATDWLRSKAGSVNARYGDVFRVARKDGKESWPIGGGSVKEAGMATPRAISFGNVGDQQIGHGGQTSTQIVVLVETAPILHGAAAGRERSSRVRALGRSGGQALQRR